MRQPRERIGYALAIVGSIVFVVSMFLRIWGISYDYLGGRGPWTWMTAGWRLWLYSGAVIICVTAVVGLFRSGPSTRWALAGATATWVVSWLGWFIPPVKYHSISFTGIVIVVAGACLVALRRHPEGEPAPPATNRLACVLILVGCLAFVASLVIPTLVAYPRSLHHVSFWSLWTSTLNSNLQPDLDAIWIPGGVLILCAIAVRGLSGRVVSRAGLGAATLVWALSWTGFFLIYGLVGPKAPIVSWAWLFFIMVVCAGAIIPFIGRKDGGRNGSDLEPVAATSGG